MTLYLQSLPTTGEHDNTIIEAEKLVLQEEQSIALSSDVVSQTLVGEALCAKIQSCQGSMYPGCEDSFFVADLGIVYRQHVRWKKHLPRVDPFYAVKCNGDTKVLQLLTRLGIGFDCASQVEISKMLSLGVEPSQIVYANPCKTPSYLRFARQAGVDLMTFDNSDELCKIAQFFPRAKLLLRIVTDDSNASCQLSNKFGASMSDTRLLLDLAKKLDLSVVGVAFHVGSGSSDPSAFVEAVENSRRVFDQALEVGLPPMSVIDVGGGFTDETFEATAKVLTSCLDQYFPSDEFFDVKVMAEPGRYYVANAFTLAVNVIGKRRVCDFGTEKAMLYVNDGVYANMNCIIYDHQNPIPRILSTSSGYHYEDEAVYSEGKFEVSVWGPSCDGLDCITKSVKLPMEIDVGDWLYFRDMGAYTLCAGSQFNGFNTSCDVVYVYSAQEARI